MLHPYRYQRHHGACESVRSRRKPVEDALTGHRAASCAHLVNRSIERKQTVYWDFEREKVKS